MNPSEIFIKRPIATSLLMAAIAFFGAVAYRAAAAGGPAGAADVP
jgi:multidrug efflux pump subunit AcrB